MDTVDPIRFVLAFLLVLGLIGVMALVLKHYVKGRAGFGAREGGGRLEVLETRYLDPRRRLVLVRRDGVEHLLLLADGRELVIESGVNNEK